MLRESLTASIGSEFIENNGEDAESQKDLDEEKRKQKCETKAFKKLAGKIKKTFPRLPIIPLADSLYASEPVMGICQDDGWEFIIRYRTRIIPSITEKHEKIPEKETAGLKTKKLKPGRSKSPADFKCIFFGLWNVPCTEIHREKTNEMPAAQELLKLMDLKGSVVTVDASNCQKDTVSAIAGSKGDYVLALKGNQPLFYKEVQEFFDEEKREEIRKRAKGSFQTLLTLTC